MYYFQIPKEINIFLLGNGIGTGLFKRLGEVRRCFISWWNYMMYIVNGWEITDIVSVFWITYTLESPQTDTSMPWTLLEKGKILKFQNSAWSYSGNSIQRTLLWNWLLSVLLVSVIWRLYCRPILPLYSKCSNVHCPSYAHTVWNCSVYVTKERGWARLCTLYS